MKQIDMTEGIRLALRLVARAEQLFRPGVDSYAFLELPKIALAEAVLEAIRAQQARTTAQVATLAKLTRAKPAVVPVGAVELRAKRRRRA